MNAPQHLHRSSAMGSTVGHIPANSWASCQKCCWNVILICFVFMAWRMVSAIGSQVLHQNPVLKTACWIQKPSCEQHKIRIPDITQIILLLVIWRSMFMGQFTVHQCTYSPPKQKWKIIKHIFSVCLTNANLLFHAHHRLYLWQMLKWYSYYYIIAQMHSHCENSGN